MVRNLFDLKTIIHQTTSPPHLNIGESVPFPKQNRSDVWINGIEFTSTKEQLLQSPYETDCFDYELNSGIKNAPKSRSDCIVKYLQKTEFRKCKYNNNWFYRNYTNASLENICHVK